MDPQPSDFFEAAQKIHNSFPRVTINLLGNLHQDKTQTYIEEEPVAENPSGDQMADSPEVPEVRDNTPTPKVIKEVLEQDNVFEIDMQLNSDVEGGIDIDHECIHGHLKFI
jgi:hypothetical protein